jgi:hypothetical protein
VTTRVESKNMAIKGVDTNTYRECNVPTSNLTQPTRLTPHCLDERREMGVCLNCESKFCTGHKCGQN